jgi:4-hydroxy-2-oxoheptanedioate aldolase
MVNNAAEAKALVSYALYPPKGKRSNGPIRAGAYGSATPYQATANDEVLIIPMIETQEAIDNIDAILDVPGISGIYVGPSDLGLSLGLVPKLDREEPQVLQIYEKLTAACKKRNLFAGIHNGTASYAARGVRHGLPALHDRQRLRPDGDGRPGRRQRLPQGSRRRPRTSRPKRWHVLCSPAGQDNRRRKR